MPKAAPISIDDRRTRRGAKTAERILDAAEALFAERGYAGTTLRDVAAAVGVRNPSLYNHFESKDALYAAVLERGIRPIFDTLTDWVDAPDGPDHRVLVARVMTVLAQRPALANLIQHEVLGGAEHMTPMLRDWVRPILTHARGMIETGPARQRWTTAQVPHLVLAMYQLVVGYFTVAPLYRELTGDDPLSAKALAEQTRFLEAAVPRLIEGT